MQQDYQDHIATLLKRYEYLMQMLAGAEGILLHSGIDRTYYQDDQDTPFRAFGHFNHWLPVNRPNQVLLVRPGRRPVYFQVIPEDYWNEQAVNTASWWAESFDIVQLGRPEQIKAELDQLQGLVFLGEPECFAAFLGIKPDLINPQSCLDYLDYHRAYKQPYEVTQLRTANQLALVGHQAAASCFLDGGSEYDIHLAYLQACQVLEHETPYTNIVAVNEKAAILHYQNKRRYANSEQHLDNQVLLLDAGCRVNAYCSDITRTTCSAHVHPIFKQLLTGMEHLQQQIIALIRPGLPFSELHHIALELVGQLLIDNDIIKCGLEEAMDAQLPAVFLPHGLGHLLGIQVHDVGGWLINPDGKQQTPPEHLLYLRNTRTLEESMVCTIEPGIYFIPLLLDKVISDTKGALLNQHLITELLPLGGIRIEDNIHVTSNGVTNLTRGN